jgi:hypothetical protein
LTTSDAANSQSIAESFYHKGHEGTQKGKKMKIRLGFSLSALLAILAIPAICFAQGVRYDNVATLDTGRPVQGATITVCASGSTGTPCTPTASIFSDSALSVPIAQPGFQSGAQGNFFFYAACGKYDISFSGNGLTSRTMKDVQLGPCGNFNAAGAANSQVKSLQIGTDTPFTAAPRSTFGGFLSGALSGSVVGTTVVSWTPDKAITVTRMEGQQNSAGPSNLSGCGVSPVMSVTDGTNNVNLTLGNAANYWDTGAVSQNFAAGVKLQIKLTTAGVSCTASTGASTNWVVQFKLQ